MKFLFLILHFFMMGSLPAEGASHQEKFRIIKVWTMESSREIQVQMVNNSTGIGLIVNLMYPGNQPATQEVFAYSLKTGQERKSPFTQHEIVDITLELLNKPFTADVTIYPSKSDSITARVSIDLKKYQSEGAYWLLTDGVEPLKELLSSHVLYAVKNFNHSDARSPRRQCVQIFSLQ